MPDFYRRIDLYLQPSIEIRHEASSMAQAESMGRAILEAQASGVPVVASRSGGIGDIVEDGRSGLLVPPGEAGPLAAAIARLCAEADLRERLAGEARRAVLERFSWDAVVEGTERAIAAVLGGGRRGTEAHGVHLPA
jgi:glycosyltransferase involved in cell wall biosynthesis